MSENLTAKQEIFCQEYVFGKQKASDAYRKAYNTDNSKNKTVWESACVLLKKPKVAARIAELRNQLEIDYNYSRNDALDEYDEAIILAKASNNIPALISAINSKCKLFGFGEDVIKHKGKIEVDGLTSLLNEINKQNYASMDT